MLLNPRYGAVGMLAMPYFAFVELLSPLMELAGWWSILSSWMLGALDVPAAAAFLLVTVLMGILLSICAVMLEELTLHRYPKVRNLLTLFSAAIFENVGYRQVTVLARTAGMIGLFMRRTGWGAQERRGRIGRMAGA
jgi:hypothetical protein